ncbi:unnamed protein product, partial [Ectocarpus sp. 12 AP-2014]
SWTILESNNAENAKDRRNVRGYRRRSQPRLEAFKKQSRSGNCIEEFGAVKRPDTSSELLELSRHAAGSNRSHQSGLSGRHTWVARLTMICYLPGKKPHYSEWFKSAHGTTAAVFFHVFGV